MEKLNRANKKYYYHQVVLQFDIHLLSAYCIGRMKIFVLVLIYFPLLLLYYHNRIDINTIYDYVLLLVVAYQDLLLPIISRSVFRWQFYSFQIVFHYIFLNHHIYYNHKILYYHDEEPRLKPELYFHIGIYNSRSNHDHLLFQHNR